MLGIGIPQIARLGSNVNQIPEIIDVVSLTYDVNYTLFEDISEPNHQHFGIYDKNPVNGKERIVYSLQDSHFSRDGVIAMRISEDNFVSETVILDINDIPSHGTRTGLLNPSIGYTPTGRMIISVMVVADLNLDEDFQYWLYSDDDGSTFTPISFSFGAGHGFVREKLKYIGSTLYWSYHMSDFTNDIHTINFCTSVDNGVSWNKVEVALTNGAAYTYAEPATIWLTPSVIVMVTRAANGLNKVQFISEDGGATWTNLGNTNIVQPNTSDPSSLYPVKIGSIDYVALFRTLRGSPSVLELYFKPVSELLVGDTTWTNKKILISDGYGRSGYQSAIISSYSSFKGVYFREEDSSGTKASIMLFNASVSIYEGILSKVLSAYKFDETSGSNAADEFLSNNGTISGCTLEQGSVLNLGTSFYFNGVDNYVSFGTNTFSFEYNQSFSFAAWIKRDYDGTKSTNDVIMCKDSSGVGFRFEIRPATTGTHPNKLALYMANQNAAGYRFSVCGSTVLDDSNWHHVAVSYDGSGDISGLHLYVDGQGETIIQLATGDTLNSTIVNGGDFRIGSRSDGTLPFKGNVDQPIICNSELLVADCMYLFNGGDGIEIENWT